MKKIFFVIAIFSTICVSAQKKVITPKSEVKQAITQQRVLSKEQIAKKNVSDLTTFAPISAEMQNVMYELFITKQRMMEDCGDSIERKQVVSGVITQKLQATLDVATFEKIKSNEKLFQSLIN